MTKVANCPISSPLVAAASTHPFLSSQASTHAAKSLASLPNPCLLDDTGRLIMRLLDGHPFLESAR